MVKNFTFLLILAILFNALLLVFDIPHVSLFDHNPFLALLAFFLFMLITIPLAFLAGKALIRHFEGMFRFNLATVFVLGCFILAIRDLINEQAHRHSTLDFQVHDTYYVIAHAHILTFFALLFLAFAAVYSLYPRLTHRLMNTPMGYLHFALTLIGVWFFRCQTNYTGLAGIPRRYIDYSGYFNRFIVITAFTSGMSFLLLAAQLVFIINLIYSAFRGRKWQPV